MSEKLPPWLCLDRLKLTFVQVTLPNGLRVFLAEDHELPLVRGTLLMRGGQRAAPPESVGAQMLRRLWWCFVVLCRLQAGSIREGVLTVIDDTGWSGSHLFCMYRPQARLHKAFGITSHLGLHHGSRHIHRCSAKGGKRE